MGWEIERSEVLKSQGIHRIIYVNRDVLEEDGEPMRCHRIIRLGVGIDGESCGHCNQPVQRELRLNADGKLYHHVTLEEHSPLEIAKKDVADLNAFHARMDAYAERHKATVYRGPK